MSGIAKVVLAPPTSGGSGITQLTGDVTAGPGGGSQTATLATAGTAGTYGDAQHTDVITTDTKGRVTAIVSTLISIVSAQVSDLATTLSAYLLKTGGTMSGVIAMGANKITGVANGTASSDVAAFGQIPVPANGYGISGNTGATPTPAVGLTTSSGVLGANVTCPAATTTKVMDTASLGVGTWLLTFELLLTLTGATLVNGDMIIATDTATATIAGPVSQSIQLYNGTGNYGNATISCLVTVTVAGTIKMSVQNPSATIGMTALALSVTAGLAATGYTAVRIQ